MRKLLGGRKRIKKGSQKIKLTLEIPGLESEKWLHGLCLNQVGIFWGEKKRKICLWNRLPEVHKRSGIQLSAFGGAAQTCMRGEVASCQKGKKDKGFNGSICKRCF